MYVHLYKQKRKAMKNNTEITRPTPTVILMIDARTKAKALKAGEQIRLTGAEHTYSYWLMNYRGEFYIAVDVKEPLCNFFKSREVFEMKNKDGEITHRLQRLM